MARSLNLRVVAEGVETLAQLTFLRNHECDEAQGYYLGRPLMPQEFATLLGTGIPVPVRESLLSIRSWAPAWLQASVSQVGSGSPSARVRAGAIVQRGAQALFVPAFAERGPAGALLVAPQQTSCSRQSRVHMRQGPSLPSDLSSSGASMGADRWRGRGRPSPLRGGRSRNVQVVREGGRADRDLTCERGRACGGKLYRAIAGQKLPSGPQLVAHAASHAPNFPARSPRTASGVAAV
jgi:hypothetical protein